VNLLNVLIKSKSFIELVADLVMGEVKYSDDQPRDDHGRWTSGGGSGFVASEKIESNVKVEAFHGTLSQFTEIEVPKTHTMVDRMLGPHFAEDPELANKFAGGLYRTNFGVRGSGEEGKYAEGGHVIPVKLEFDNVKEVLQPPNRVGIINSDQYAIAQDVARVVLPERRDMFVALMKANKIATEEQANAVYDTLKAGKEVTADVAGEVFAFPKSYTDEDHQPYDFGTYTTNFAAGLFYGIDKVELVSVYKDIMAKQGIQGLKYQNTSPMETEGVKNKTCYIVLDKKAIKPYLKFFGLAAIFKYSDDQPRDDHGRWTDGGALQAYHGTSSTFVNEILKEGIAPQKQHNWWGDFYTGERGKSVYVCNDLRAALYWGKNAAEREYTKRDIDDPFRQAYTEDKLRMAVFRVEIPKEAKIKLDEHKTGSRVVGTIKPEWIKGYEVYRQDKFDKERKNLDWVLLESHNIKQAAEVYYVPLVFIVNEEKKKSVVHKSLTKAQKDSWEAKWRKIVAKHEKEYAGKLRSAYAGIRQELLGPKEKSVIQKYSDDQPRDDHGRFTNGSGVAEKQEIKPIGTYVGDPRDQVNGVETNFVDWLSGKGEKPPEPDVLYRGTYPNVPSKADQGPYVHTTPWATVAESGGMIGGSGYTVHMYENAGGTIFYRGGALAGDPLERTRISSVRGMTWNEALDAAKKLYDKDVDRKIEREKKFFRQTGHEFTSEDVLRIRQQVATDVFNDFHHAVYEADLHGTPGKWRNREEVPPGHMRELPPLRTHTQIENWDRKHKSIRIKANFDYNGWEFDLDKWQEVFELMEGEFVKDMYDLIGNEVYEHLQYVADHPEVVGRFDVENPNVQEFIQDYSYKFAEEAMTNLVEEVRGVIDDGMSEGLGNREISSMLQEVFDYRESSYSDLVARTETIRASNAGAIESYKQSGVVRAKEWLCTEDDRLCEFCSAMNGTIIELDDNFFDEGDDFTLGKNSLAMDYEDVGGPPLHPNCRCTLIPVVDEQYLPQPDDEEEKMFGLGAIFKYSDDQARDSHGRWTSGGGSLSEYHGDFTNLYHGTSSSFVDMILKEGIRPGGLHSNFDNSRERTSSTYMAHIKHTAQIFGQMAVDQFVKAFPGAADKVRLALFTIDVPKGTKLKVDEVLPNSSVRFKGTIPKEWIRGYEIYKYNNKANNRDEAFQLMETHKLKQSGFYYIPVLFLEEMKKEIGLSAIFKYSDDQARDAHGRWTSTGAGTDEQDASKISHEQRMAQASYGDIRSNMKSDLKEIMNTSSTYHPKEVEGKLTSDNVKTIAENAKMEVRQFSTYLAGDTMGRMRDFVDHLQSVISAKSLETLDAKMVNSFATDCIHKMVYQEVESNRQQFTDHGIRHIEGNIIRMDEIMKAATDGHPDAMDRLMGIAIMVNHDVGYTTPLIREGGERAIAVSKDHTAFGEKIYGEQRSIWNEDKLFSGKQYDRILDIIKTHDSTEINMKDTLGTATRLSDNLSLFGSEKLPGMFQYVHNGESYLTALGKAAAEKDVVTFEKVRGDLHDAIDKTHLSEPLKRDLKSSVREINYLTPKFTMGVLAGSISSIQKEAGKVVINVRYSKFDAFLQKHFDMGQRQTKHLLEDYGHKDFSKTSYDLGDFARIQVHGVATKELGLGAIFKYSDDQPRDYHGRWTSGGESSGSEHAVADHQSSNATMHSVESRIAASIAASHDARVQRAIESHKPITKGKIKLATANEIAIAVHVKGAIHIGGNRPFDIHIGNPVHAVIEVKTIIKGKNDKITMHPPSIEKKDRMLKSLPKGTTAHTVVIDERDKQVYYKSGYGSFRLSNMKALGDKEHALKKISRMVR
jgi:SPP1 gp7 family putative phage head morphogenesis protein